MLDVGAAGSGGNDLLDTSAVGSKDLLLESSDGKDLSSEGHLSSHGCR